MLWIFPEVRVIDATEKVKGYAGQIPSCNHM